MKVKNTYICRGNYMEIYKRVMDSLAFRSTPFSVMYECENDQWFIMSSDRGLVEIEKNQALSLLEGKS